MSQVFLSINFRRFTAEKESRRFHGSRNRCHCGIVWTTSIIRESAGRATQKRARAMDVGFGRHAMALLAPPAPANAPPRPREVFLPGDSRRQSRLGALRRRLRWPLGVYTTPVAILIVWEILAQAGILKPAYAPAPSDILTTTVELWRDGILGPDLAISLQRAGIVLQSG